METGIVKNTDTQRRVVDEQVAIATEVGEETKGSVVGAEVEAAKTAGLNWILKNRKGSSGSQKAKE